MTIRNTTQAAALLIVLVWPVSIFAAPRLVLGRPEVTSKGTVAVPILLRARGSDQIAALNFTLHAKRHRGVVLSAVEAGGAVERAGATLYASNTREGDAILALVVPQFTVPLAVMRAGRVATVEIQRGRDSPARVRRALRLKDVVLSDTDAHALRPPPRGRQRRAVRR